jgi:GT2 family glycosyltransferase
MSTIGPFDERLGVGAGTPWNSGEETDYLVRAARLGTPGIYDPGCIVHHRRPVWSDRGSRNRALTYGRGIGFVLRKNRAGVGIVARFLLRPLGGAFLAGLLCRWRKAGFHIAVFRGRLSGWMVGV